MIYTQYKLSGTMSRWFSTDPLFCPYCGTILPLPVNSGSVNCKLCDYQQDASGEQFLAPVFLY